MLEVIVTSTCRKTIKTTIESFKKNFRYSKEFKFIIHIDVIYPKNVDWIKSYLKKNEIVNYHLNYHPKGHANAINYLNRKITGKYYFHLEDDWIFLKKVDLDPIISLMEKYRNIDHIRFSREKITEKALLYHLLPEQSKEVYENNRQVQIDGIYLVRTPLWSFNPYVGRTSIMKKIREIPINRNPEKFFCFEYLKLNRNIGTYIYGKIGDEQISKDIGRKHVIIRIMKKLIKDPTYLIKKYLLGNN